MESEAGPASDFDTYCLLHVWHQEEDLSERERVLGTLEAVSWRASWVRASTHLHSKIVLRNQIPDPTVLLCV